MTGYREKREPTREEITLWRHAMRDVVAFARVPSSPVPADPPPGGEPVVPFIAPVRVAAPAPARASSALPLEPGRAAGVDRRSIERLRHGERPIEAVLDLHGLTREGAFVALKRFLFDSAEADRRCVLVITGKGSGEGGGVLRAEAPRWLNAEPLRGLVLAFAYARPRHGGVGALYVLLKRRRR